MGLVRVFSSNAEVVVLDEPLMNLDEESIGNLTAYIAEIKKEKSIIAIMHSAELDAMADMILRIDNKKLCIEK